MTKASEAVNTEEITIAIQPAQLAVEQELASKYCSDYADTVKLQQFSGVSTTSKTFTFVLFSVLNDTLTLRYANSPNRVKVLAANAHTDIVCFGLGAPCTKVKATQTALANAKALKLNAAQIKVAENFLAANGIK